jgi:hypothetical protein
MPFYSVERCQILECEKDLLLKVNFMDSVTKQSYVKMLISRKRSLWSNSGKATLAVQ